MARRAEKVSRQITALKKAVSYLKELDNIAPELRQMSAEFKAVDISEHNKGRLTALAVHLDNIIVIVKGLIHGKNAVTD
jgi:hypothetical protein